MDESDNKQLKLNKFCKKKCYFLMELKWNGLKKKKKLG